jgi:hypothetical protein
MLSRRSFLQTTGAGAVAARLLGVTDPADAAPALAPPQGTQKPNILFMLVDNLGYGELGVYGGARRAAHRPRASTSSRARGCGSRT